MQRNGHSVVELANKLQIPKAELAAFETGEDEPKTSVLELLADHFQVSLDSLVKEDLHKSPKMSDFECKFLVLDVDGTMTDGGMYYTEHSEDEFKKFNTKDGRAIKNIVKHGIKVGIISSGFNDNLIKRRAKLLGIEYVHVGLGKKLEVLNKWCDELSIDLKQVAYVGDDTNDMDVIQVVGLSACPADALNSVKLAVDVVLQLKGGDGCVREFVDDYIMVTP